MTLTQTAITVASPDWRYGFLDLGDISAVRAYEERLYRAFLPALEINPLIRNLWIWDDEARRLRTRVPYGSQRVALMTDPATGATPISVGINVDTGRHWQSGAYGFERPSADDHTCEFLIFGNGSGGTFNSASAIRNFVRHFLFGELARMGFRTALATTADHMLWFYRRIGADIEEQRLFDGHRRTLLRWDLGRGTTCSAD